MAEGAGMSEAYWIALFGLSCGIPLGYVGQQAWVRRRGRKWVVAAVLALGAFLALLVASGRVTAW
jgi:hypothetical protein